MELLKVEDVHLTYPPRFKRPGGRGGPDTDDLGDADGGLAGDEYEEAREREDEEEVGAAPRGDVPVVALRGVTLTVNAGDAVGILGAVGSGRTTLLSLITGVLRPDQGRVRIRGRATGLMAAGAGFFGDLSIRDNLVRNALLMGTPRARALELVEPIVEFSGIPEPLDTPVRSLSRAHTKRLGYAAALHAEPTVLLGDEELVVGPAELREAGLARLAAFPSPTRALVVVTNRRDHLNKLCNRAVVLTDGEVAFDGSLAEGLAFYHRPRRRSRHGEDEPAPPDQEAGDQDPPPRT